MSFAHVSAVGQQRGVLLNGTRIRSAAVYTVKSVSGTVKTVSSKAHRTDENTTKPVNCPSVTSCDHGYVFCRDWWRTR